MPTHGADNVLPEPSGFKILNRLAGSRFKKAVLTGYRQGVGPKNLGVPDVPQGWAGTRSEWALFWAHQRLGLREFRDFLYARNYTSGADLGAKFFELGPQIAILIRGQDLAQGFLVDLGTAKEMRQTANQGYAPVLIDEDDAIRDPVFYLKEALKGRDHSLSSRGLG